MSSYRSSSLSNGSYPYRKKTLLKMVILGDQGVGKTALIDQYINKRFTKAYKSTIGTDFHNKDIILDDQIVTLQIWDTAGMERFNSLNESYYRGADCCLLVFDITLTTSFKTLPAWRQSFFKNSTWKQDGSIPFLVIGNKCDLDNRMISTRRVEQWCRDNGNLPYLECSAKDGSNVEEAFLMLVKEAVKNEKSNIEKVEFPDALRPLTLNTAPSDDRICSC